MRLPPRSTRTDTLFPTRRSSDVALGPAWRAERQTGDLAVTLIERIEALDGYYARFLPQSRVAMILPILILVAVYPVDWVSGVILTVAGPFVPLMMALIGRSEEHPSELQSLMRISYAVFCLK